MAVADYGFAGTEPGVSGTSQVLHRGRSVWYGMAVGYGGKYVDRRAAADIICIYAEMVH